jgi:ArsR family transcriptional regulator, lead/cadmium/zinc/bismuth-responsive transcriptional repressor
MPALLERNIEELTCDAYNDDPTRVRRVARVMPSDETFENASLLLKAIADPVRARILFALTIEPLCVCELSVLLEMSMPAVSHHLKTLLLSGLLKVKKEGKFASYSLREEHRSGLVGSALKHLTAGEEPRR